jgi:hypothetical protein
VNVLLLAIHRAERRGIRGEQFGGIHLRGGTWYLEEKEFIFYVGAALTPSF